MVVCLFHTAKITIHALRMLVLFCSNFNLYSSFASFFVAESDVFSRLSVGDSARSLRSRRNGAHRWAEKGEKDGRRKKRTVAGKLTAAAHLFPLFDPKRDAPFRRRR